MEQECNTENENEISWGKAYLYAFRWLIGWVVIVYPILLAICFAGKYAFIIAIVVSILLLILMMIIIKRVHRSWKVPIAFFAGVAIATGLFYFLLLILASACMSPV